MTRRRSERSPSLAADGKPWCWPGATVATALAIWLPAPAAHAEGSAVAPVRTKLAVMDLRGLKGIDAEQAQAASQYAATRVASTGRYDVITREDIAVMLEHENLKMQMGCEETSCLAEIGGALGVDLLLAGSLTTVGPSVLVNLNLVDVRQAQVLRREAERVPLQDREVDVVLLAAIDTLLLRMLEVPRPEAPPVSPPTPARAEASDGGLRWAWVALGGAALGLVAGGVATAVGVGQMTEAERLAQASATEAVSYDDFQQSYQVGQIGWYGGLGLLGLGAVGAAAAGALFWLERPAEVSQ